MCFLKLIPFEVTIPEAERDPDLVDRLVEEEGAGILRWVIEGACRYEEQGLTPEPDAVRLAIGEYRTESDRLGIFLDERCRLAATFSVSSTRLYEAWSNWCDESGERTGTKTAFGREMTGRGFGRSRTESDRMYVGLRLLQDDERKGLTVVKTSVHQ